MTIDGELAAHKMRSFSHIQKSKVTARRVGGGLKSLSIVRYQELNRVSTVEQIDPYVLGPAVFHGIGHSFLTDA